MQILKANGQAEEFSEKKLIHSIHRAGIPQQMQREVMAHVTSKLYEHIPTKEIYHHISEFLGKSPHPYTKTKYSLKQAIMDLGPTGYPFEDYVAKILVRQNYTTQTRQIIQGRCITHEIDVIAENHAEKQSKILIEAKFHNAVGLRTNVHVPMYTKARFDDVKENNNFSEVWVITNTKASVEAIAYAGCVGMRIITWSYPEGGSLREWVEKFHMYPVTALTTLSAQYKQQLLSQGIVLCKDICDHHALLESLGLPHNQRQQVIEEIEFICIATK